MVFCILYSTSILMNFDLWNSLWSTFYNGATIVLTSFIYYFVVMYGLIMSNFALYGGYKRGYLSFWEALMSTLQNTSGNKELQNDDFMIRNLNN